MRAPSGEILFAYSEYVGTSADDHAACNIVMLRSADEGETWTKTPETIATAAFFEAQNVMSVSSMSLLNGTLAFYFLIKEYNGTSVLGRSISKDGGKTSTPEPSSGMLLLRITSSITTVWFVFPMAELPFPLCMILLLTAKAICITLL